MTKASIDCEKDVGVNGKHSVPLDNGRGSLGCCVFVLAI